MRLEEERELIAKRPDVWALLAAPEHLADWWPGYTTVRPDRRGLAAGARWQVVRGALPGLIRKPGGEGLVVVTAVEPETHFGWRDVQQGFAADIRLEPAAEGHTLAVLTVEAPWWRLIVEGIRPLPRRALGRLHALQQTAASL